METGGMNDLKMKSVHDLFPVVMLQLIRLNAKSHAIFMEGFLSELNVLRLDFSGLAGTFGPTQRLVVRHELLNSSSVLGHDRVTSVEPGISRATTM